MSEITITLDASKLRKLLYTEEYTDKNGEKKQVQKVKFKLVEMKEQKEIFSAEKYTLNKTHFACEIQTKEERDAKKETNYIGEGVSLIWKDSINNTTVYNAVPVTGEEIENETDDLLF